MKTAPDLAPYFQSSGGLLLRVGTLARGALVAAAMEHCPIATAEHVRAALSKIF
ncbi:MAG: hypothetical protein ACLQMF_10690 [Rectinemataceae bacterium]